MSKVRLIRIYAIVISIIFLALIAAEIYFLFTPPVNPEKGLDNNDIRILIVAVLILIFHLNILRTATKYQAQIADNRRLLNIYALAGSVISFLAFASTLILISWDYMLMTQAIAEIAQRPHNLPGTTPQESFFRIFWPCLVMAAVSFVSFIIHFRFLKKS